MRYKLLGRTGVQVSAVSLGTAPLGNMFGPVDEQAAIATVHDAIDSGVTFFDTSPYYGAGLSELRLGKALRRRRGEVLVGTKAGRYGDAEFNFQPAHIRRSLETSLRLLETDYVDIFQLHDIEFANLDSVFNDAYPELVKLRGEGKCRFVGMTGYPMHTLRRAVRETALDTVLSYAHFTLLNTQLASDLLPTCEERGTAVMNAAAVSLGLLTTSGTNFAHHPANKAIKVAANSARQACMERGVDIGFLANQFAIQRSHCLTTVIGTTKESHLDSAIRAADEPIDEELLAEVLARTEHVRNLSWPSGRPENNADDAVTAGRPDR